MKMGKFGRKISHGLLFWTVSFLTFIPFTEANAYLDPGTGSMVLQLLLGGVAGAVVVVKMYWEKVKFFFTKGKSS